MIARYNAAWNHQDPDEVCSFHATTVVFQNHTAGERAEGAEAVRARIAAIFSRWPDLAFRSRRTYVGEAFVACEWTATAPDGRSVEWAEVDSFPLSDGLIARKDVYSSSATPRILDPGGG
jgi:ketosteroid isomerase-like protein